MQKSEEIKKTIFEAITKGDCSALNDNIVSFKQAFSKNQDKEVIHLILGCDFESYREKGPLDPASTSLFKLVVNSENPKSLLLVLFKFLMDAGIIDAKIKRIHRDVLLLLIKHPVLFLEFLKENVDASKEINLNIITACSSKKISGKSVPHCVLSEAFFAGNDLIISALLNLLPSKKMLSFLKEGVVDYLDDAGKNIILLPSNLEKLFEKLSPGECKEALTTPQDSWNNKHSMPSLLRGYLSLAFRSFIKDKLGQYWLEVLKKPDTHYDGTVLHILIAQSKSYTFEESLKDKFCLDTGRDVYDLVMAANGDGMTALQLTMAPDYQHLFKWMLAGLDSPEGLLVLMSQDKKQHSLLYYAKEKGLDIFADLLLQKIYQLIDFSSKDEAYVRCTIDLLKSDGEKEESRLQILQSLDNIQDLSLLKSRLQEFIKFDFIIKEFMSIYIDAGNFLGNHSDVSVGLKKRMSASINDAYHHFLANNSLEESFKLFLKSVTQLINSLSATQSVFCNFFWRSDPLKKLLDDAVERAHKIKGTFCAVELFSSNHSMICASAN